MPKQIAARRPSCTVGYAVGGLVFLRSIPWLRIPLMADKIIDIKKVVAAAIEADAADVLPDLRQALAEAQAGLGRVTTPGQILVRQAREMLGLTQAAFAERIETPVATLRDWKQGRFAPPGGHVPVSADRRAPPSCRRS